ncbi:MULTISPECIES: PhaM family polyhydroxyalkanoate granule multifunctional regulatory protein [Achromobacter]|uniref:Transcriptional regulator n=1 Tax=Achromobacter spanius TaxID=217203 RepID=A0ABY8GQ67_9BURK|nr:MULTISPECIES: PhaM family polyhydroxyalkanoate granule multifunctional regulatory protein [Achromobacter]WAI83975.1 transcriptional regulator [Achromobacter spanius]WEX94057.1 transcriptional regulator [Achromobacter sp. SS2-2022]WFP06781.1 transcriptional regulator [Achromobacter spanius]
MSDQFTNPFVLPGMGQNSDLSGNPLLASMEMMRQAWAGLTGPGGLASSLPMAPPMNLEDLDRRIAELRSVENWLRMNLSMLSSTIQGMEVQRSTISTLRAFVDSAASMDMNAVRESGAASPLEVVLGLKPAPKSAAKPSASDSARDAKPQDSSSNASSESDAGNASAADSAGPGMTEQMGAAAQSASKAWWDLLQQQFNQIAAATAASMPTNPAEPGESATPKPKDSKPAAKTEAKASKPATRKPAARKTAAKSAPRASKNNGPADGKP